MNLPAYDVKSLPGSDDIIHYSLPNGITLLIRINKVSPSVSVKGYLECGSILDPDKKLGLANLTAAAVTTGTQKQDFVSLHNIIESIGANLSVNGGTLTTNFSLQCLTEDLPTMIRLLSEVLQQPSFPLKQFKRLKAQYLTMLAIMAQDTAEMADFTFNEMIYAGHPYGRNEDGTPETINSIEIEDLREFHKSFFSPSGLVIAVVGAVNPDEVIRIVSDSLGMWETNSNTGKIAIPEAKVLDKPARKHIALEEKSQSDIVMGNLAPTRSSSDFMPCYLGNNILGQFGMMGRIGQSIRERSGLAYFAQSELSSGVGPGTWQFIAGVNPVNLEKAIDLIKDEIKKFIDNSVTDEELSDTKSYLVGRLPALHESNSGVAVSLLNLQRFDLGFDYLRHYPEMVYAITKEDILSVARKYLSLNSLAVASAGKAIE